MPQDEAMAGREYAFYFKAEKTYGSISFSVEKR